MRVCDYVARWLLLQGIDLVFDLPGGMISPLLDALDRTPGMRAITMHHEQGAAFAADAASRLRGTPAVALATVGPGAINLLSGIASCHYDSSPTLFLTGQVQTYLQKGERPVRQFGFQEVDAVAMAEGITKAAIRVRSGEEVPAILAQALPLLLGGRPGPVLIDLPMDLQGAEIDAEPQVAAPLLAPEPADAAAVEEALDLLAGAERPLVLAGGGVRAARAFEVFRAFAQGCRVPVVSSIMALDVLPAADPLRVGMIGMYGNRWANLAMLESDVILVLGSRLDPGQTSADAVAWKRGKKIFQVDCDPTELDLRVRGLRTLQADVRAFLSAAVERLGEREIPSRPAWAARIESLRQQFPDTAELDGCPGINPNRFVRQLSAASAPAAAFTVDAGQHTWWASQSIQLRAGQRFLPATGLGPMGFSLPGGIGAAVAAGRPVVVLVGDGALQINLQELQTIVRHHLPVKIVVFNNHCHGMVRQFQETAFEGRYPATVQGYSAPDFARVAEAFGIAGRTVKEMGETEEAVRWLWQEPEAPALLQVEIPVETNVYPIVPFGLPLSEMESFQRKSLE
ncbi:MAG TPA: thiamine pyrophosphate-binding protein [Thermoanaerobaculia bacterium]|nr:thiamine pyrophosphate-binding protein [Thermoanaerobaculia bacterium]